LAARQIISEVEVRLPLEPGVDRPHQAENDAKDADALKAPSGQRSGAPDANFRFMSSLLFCYGMQVMPFQPLKPWCMPGFMAALKPSISCAHCATS
jgi:hypothetical protein